MTMTKCAHEGCNCQVAPGGKYGKYCSDHCKDGASLTELRCGCPHSECRA